MTDENEITPEKYRAVIMKSYWMRNSECYRDFLDKLQADDS